MGDDTTTTDSASEMPEGYLFVRLPDYYSIAKRLAAALVEVEWKAGLCPSCFHGAGIPVHVEGCPLGDALDEAREAGLLDRPTASTDS